VASGDNREPRREVLREAVGGLVMGAAAGGALWVLLCWAYVDYVGQGLRGDAGYPWMASRWVALGLVAAGAVIGLIAGVRMELRRTR
jgi:hypothetical protein